MDKTNHREAPFEFDLPSAHLVGAAIGANRIQMVLRDGLFCPFIIFVSANHEDYEWTKQTIAKHHLNSICPVLISWVQPLAPQQQDQSLKKVLAGQTPISRL